MADKASVREYLLVLRCQAGDERAFADLFNRFRPRTLRHLEGLLGFDAAQDAQQEVWLTVYRRISLLIGTLSTVGIFLRLRTASLGEVQLRLAALEEMLLSKQIEDLD